MDILNQSRNLLFNPKNTKWICPLLIAADAVLCSLIIWKVSYTEIDWVAYMEQVTQYISGERDYLNIKGGTGPLVYPAAHIYIYRFLYDLTNQGKNILLAQKIFAGFYLFELAIVMQCYRLAKAPPYIFPLLIFSKRLHSIFMLRCFNDCFAVGALFIAILAYQKHMWTIGSLAYSFGLGIKMNLLLVLPAIGIMLLQAVGRGKALRQAMLMAQVQVLIAIPFVRENASNYLSRAFEFSRQFFYKWTVNWRFVPEETFLSKQFTLTLMAIHITLLVIFFTTRWMGPSLRPLKSNRAIPITINLFLHPPSQPIQDTISRDLTPEWILTTLLTANAIGMLCARSLHYQFYSWLAWCTPFLLWRARFHPVLIYLLWAAQEWAWNVYPSTPISSAVVVSVLALQILGVWNGTRECGSGDIPKKDHVQ